MLKKFLKKEKGANDKSAIDIIEESFHILRSNCGRLLPLYLIGTIPFAAMFLFFMNDAAIDPSISAKIPHQAALLTLLFMLKSGFDSFFCFRINEILNIAPREKIGAANILMVFVFLGIVKPFCIIFYLLSLIFLLPFGWILAFSHNMTALSFCEQNDFWKLVKKSWSLACVNPSQNHLLIAVIAFFALAVFLNTGVMILLMPLLMKTFLNTETVFSTASDPQTIMRLIFNSTFFSITCMTAYLAADLLLKTGYTVRLFYCDSITTGRDLVVDICREGAKRAGKRVFTAFFISAFWVFPISGSEPSPASQPEISFINSPEMGSNIKSVLERREFAWRIPTDKSVAGQDSYLMTYIKAIFDFIEEWIQSVIEFWSKLMNLGGGAGLNFNFTKRDFIALATIISALAGLLILYFYFKARKNRVKKGVEATFSTPMPDLESEHVSADMLEESGWMELAADLAANGDLKLAARAIFLACIVSLNSKNALSIAKHKTNLDYYREINRRYHSHADIISAYSENLLGFEEIWYGTQQVDNEMISVFKNNYRIISGK